MTDTLLTILLGLAILLNVSGVPWLFVRMRRERRLEAHSRD